MPFLLTVLGNGGHAGPCCREREEQVPPTIQHPAEGGGHGVWVLLALFVILLLVLGGLSGLIGRQCRTWK